MNSCSGNGQTNRPESSPFRLNMEFKGRFRQSLLSPSYRLVERLLLFNQLDRIYREIRRVRGDKGFLATFLELMNVTYEMSDADRARIPSTGPAIVVANHPYGAIEAVIMCVLFKEIRQDSKVLANFLLSRIPEVHDYCIFVDPFGIDKSKKRNIAPMLEALDLVKKGGMLGVFPSGEVSHVDFRGRMVVDKRWNASVGRIIRKTQAPVIPMFIEGHNGPLFQLVGMIHPRLRTAMLPHELLNKRNRRIRVSVGQPVPFEKLRLFAADSDMMDYLQFRTYALGNRSSLSRAVGRGLFRGRLRRKPKDIAPAENPDLMAAEIRRLPPDQHLAENGDLHVYCAYGTQVSRVLSEIGRLREISFRLEGEGTGRSRDIDRFDRQYMHLFVWNAAKKEVVGAYRIARTDEVVARYGKRGLYTSTLFRYRRALLKKLGPSLELGRSFVRPEYQRDYSSLQLLWKGIGRMVAARPEYYNLFGPVSVSNEYKSVSRWLLATFLKHNNFDPELAKLIRARKPLKNKPMKGCLPTIFDRAVRDVETISAVISDIEGNAKSMPILLRQYLRLGGRLLGFNVDPKFGNVVDGLILVDLRQTDRKHLIHFMGRDGYEKFMARHPSFRPPVIPAPEAPPPPHGEARAKD